MSLTALGPAHMNAYGRGRGEKGLAAYENGSNWIRCQFRDGSIYVYDYDPPGPVPVESMHELSDAGSGLTTYINQYVRDDYALIHVPYGLAVSPETRFAVIRPAIACGSSTGHHPCGAEDR